MTEPAPAKIAVSVDDAIAAIRAWARATHMSQRLLARKSKLGRSTLKGIDNPGWAPGADTLRTLYAMIPPDFDPASAPPPLEGESLWQEKRRLELEAKKAAREGT